MMPPPKQPAAAATDPKPLVLVFSKDRPLQLEATLRSLYTCAQDAADLRVVVIVKATGEAERTGYRVVGQEHPAAELVPETDFNSQVQAYVGSARHVMFVVDDTVFVRSFAVSDAVAALEAQANALGVSLRLGHNTTHCYPLNDAQRPPEFFDAGDAHSFWQGFDWTHAHHDFGYPLEVSSSLYRSADLRPWLARLAFHHPNSLEEQLAAVAREFSQSHPWLLCARQSLAFSIPANRVQNTNRNRASASASTAAPLLTARFLAGQRLDLRPLLNHTPCGAHEEVAFDFQRASDVAFRFAAAVDHLPPFMHEPRPDRAPPYPAYAVCLAEVQSHMQGGQAEVAALCLERYLHDHVDDATALNDLAAVRAGQGNLAAARSALERLVHAHPTHLEGRQNLAKVMLLQNDASAAKHVISALQKDQPANATIARLAVAVGL